MVTVVCVPWAHAESYCYFQWLRPTHCFNVTLGNHNCVYLLTGVKYFYETIFTNNFCLMAGRESKVGILYGYIHWQPPTITHWVWTYIWATTVQHNHIHHPLHTIISHINLPTCSVFNYLNNLEKSKKENRDKCQM